MRVLAVETSTTCGTVAALDGDRLISELELERQRRTAQTLAPAIEQVLAEATWTTRDVQLVAVTRGPGSFTGLRLGVTTAKTFAYAASCEVMGVNTLDVLAIQARGATQESIPICAIMDAHRQQLFTKTVQFGADNSELSTVCPARIEGIEPWLEALTSEVLITGPVLEKVLPRLPTVARISDRVHWEPRAEMVGRLALQAYMAGRRDDLWKLVPEYYRASAAEEKASRSPAPNGGKANLH